jgi:hypothetical protein
MWDVREYVAAGRSDSGIPFEHPVSRGASTPVRRAQ